MQLALRSEDASKQTPFPRTKESKSWFALNQCTAEQVWPGAIGTEIDAQLSSADASGLFAECQSVKIKPTS